MNDITIHIMTQISMQRANVVCRVVFDVENEMIHAYVDDAHYVMSVSSDDDEYVFVNIDDANDIVRFPIACDDE